jgi:hypothetical protein
VGVKAQVQLAQYTADVMTRKLIKARGEFVKTLTGFRQAKIVEADGFCHGWVQAVRRTVQEFAVPDETRRLIREKIETQTGGKQADSQRRHVGGLGLAAGHRAGAEESIHRPVNEVARPRLTKS